MKLAWDYFAKWASYAHDGKRLIVPLLGAGFNSQAGARVGWGDLLRKVQAQLGLQVDLPDDQGIVGNTTLAWEAMVLELAFRNQRQPHEVEEDRLLPAVAEVLNQHYPPNGTTSKFAKQFLGYGFSDVVSFNFDEVLLAEPWEWQPSPKPADFSKTSTYALLRKSRTRVWFPHGNVRYPKSIQLGQRNYGTFIDELEQARRAYKEQETALKEELFGRAAEPSTDAQRAQLWNEHRARARNWLCVVMNAPLVFIGLGMGREEWPLWWLLNQRARNHARRAIERPVFVFMRRDEADRLRIAADLANLNLLVFDSFDRGWQRLLDAFALPTQPFAGTA